MGRRPAEKRNCAVCGDAANGINFGAPSCLSCKAFFRRNANRKDKLFRCPFNNDCDINNVTRKFCARCRLEKCTQAGMKKELILSDDERQLLKHKIKQNRELKQKQFDEAIRRATEHFQKTESETNSKILKTLSTMEQSKEAMSDFLSEFFKPNNINAAASSSKIEQSEYSSSETNETKPLMADSLDLDQILDNFGDQIIDQWGDIEQILNSPDGTEYSGNEYSTENSQEMMISPYQSPKFTNILSKYDSILEFIPLIASTLNIFTTQSNHSLPLELGFPQSDLLITEKYLLKELYSACTVLKNPYKRIREFEQLDLEYSGRMTEFILYRLIRMSKQIGCFTSKARELQGKMLKQSLIEMMVLLSVLMYNSYRDAWAFVDDNYQVSIMFRTATLAPYCQKCNFARHRALPGRFRDEWRDDTIIFDLLTAMILFTPRPEYEEYALIQEEYTRYSRLLHRYLRIKYSSHSEADECFTQLMANLNEVFHLAEDIFEFFKIHQVRFQKNPFFIELLDLPNISHFQVDARIEDITHLAEQNYVPALAPAPEAVKNIVPVETANVITNFWL